MEQYIDKSTLVAELNRLIAELVEEGENTMFEQGRISAFEDVKVFINHTLEVKEVDLEKDEPVSKDLEEAACEYADGENPTCPCEECLIKTFKAGAIWQKDHTCFAGRTKTIEEIKEALLSEVLPCFMHGGEADEVVAKLDEVLNKK